MLFPLCPPSHCSASPFWMLVFCLVPVSWLCLWIFLSSHCECALCTHFLTHPGTSTALRIAMSSCRGISLLICTFLFLSLFFTRLFVCTQTHDRTQSTVRSRREEKKEQQNQPITTQLMIMLMMMIMLTMGQGFHYHSFLSFCFSVSVANPG